MSIRIFLVVMMASLFAGAGAFAQGQAPATPAAPPGAASTALPGTTPAGVLDSGSSSYILGRDDVIEVGLIGRTDFGGRTRVQADGSIQLPLIGKLAVADHTTAEVSEMVRKALQTGGFFADPVVSVEVVGYASRYVVVLGAVGNPGIVPINRPYHVSEILARVGGVREGAADYLSVRSTDGKERKLSIRELATGDSTQDPYVQAGDKIYAPMADLFYVYGEVKSPGAFSLVSDMTVRMAIARAGGVTENGSDSKVEVTRGGKKTKLDPSAKIQPGDILKIGERLF